MTLCRMTRRDLCPVQCQACAEREVVVGQVVEYDHTISPHDFGPNVVAKDCPCMSCSMSRAVAYERTHPRVSSPCADPIVESVVTELRARSVVGVRKYGVTLEGLTHRQALRHALEECLDAANYLQAAIMRLDGEAK